MFILRSIKYALDNNPLTYEDRKSATYTLFETPHYLSRKYEYFLKYQTK